MLQNTIIKNRLYLEELSSLLSEKHYCSLDSKQKPASFTFIVQYPFSLLYTRLTKHNSHC